MSPAWHGDPPPYPDVQLDDDLPDEDLSYEQRRDRERGLYDDALEHQREADRG